MSTPAADGGVPAPPRIRRPLQRRTSEAWNRILQAGVALLEEGGYHAFTIAAVCERAKVAPRALYDRVDDKEALFFAVYEHGVARLRADEEVFGDAERWRGLPADRLVREAVRELAEILARHAAFLRPVVLISDVNPEVYLRGTRYGQEFADRFAGVLLRVRDEISHPEPETAIRLVFDMLFCTLVLRTAYRPGFAIPATDGEAFLDMLADMAQRYLLR